MNATTPTHVAVTSGLILALDLGQYKSVACAYDRATAAARFETVTTARDDLRTLFTKDRPTLMLFEACALAGWVSDLCAELHLPCKAANTAAEARKFKHAKRKTDKDDSLRLAQLEALGLLPTACTLPKATREWRALITGRQNLVGRRVAAQSRIRSLLVGQGLAAPWGHRAWPAAGLAGIARHARPLADCGPDELWRGLLDLALTEYRQALDLLEQAEARLDQLAGARAGVRLLESIPGVGPRTAEAVVAHLHEPKRFTSGKQVSAYAGLVPRQFQSGESNRRGRITRRGPSLLRKLLVECAWVMLRYNAWAPRGLPAAQPRRGPQEAGDRGPGRPAAGALPGHAPRRGPVAPRRGATGGRACPLHRGDQRGRTSSVNPEANVFRCFDQACGRRGDVIDFWSGVYGLSLRDAARDVLRLSHLKPTALGTEKRNGLARWPARALGSSAGR